MVRHKVLVKKRPDFPTIEEHDKAIRSQAGSSQLESIAKERDGKCHCCGAAFPAAASAIIACEDITPYTTGEMGEQGMTVCLCADCFTYGVRPAYVRYGDLNWNQEGNRVRQRVSNNREHPMKT